MPQPKSYLMKLYYAETLMPRKACAVACHLGSPVDFVHVDLARGEHKTAKYLAINPNGKVPVLVDGERTLWEANAIMCRLSVDAGGDLWPDDADRQIDIVRWLCWDGAHFTRSAGEIYFQYIIKAQFGLGDPDASAIEDAMREFRTYAGILDDHLRGRRFLVGDRLSVADFAVAVTLPYAKGARLPLDDYPAVKAWHDRLNELPGWREPFPAAAAAA
jgi:glutathione S-transferase